MKKILFFFIIFLSSFILSKSFAIEVSMLEAEKRLIFQQLFSNKTCGTIYENINFGDKKKLRDEVLLKVFHNIKRVNIDEEKAILTVALDQRNFSYKEPNLEKIIFQALAVQDFSEELSTINETVAISKTKKIVVCEYNLNSGLEDGKFFNFDMTYDNHLKVETNVEPKILIYYDGTIEYVFYDEKVDYAIPDFNYRLYPFDKHELRFNISSGIYDKLYIERSDRFKILLEETKKNDYDNISFPGFTIKRYISFPISSTLVDVYSDYAKHSITTEFLIERNSISFVFKFIMPIVMIILVTYFTIFLPFEFYRISVCITLVLSLVAFNLVAAASKIPDMPYLNIFDWFIFTAYINAISVLIVTFIESIYIGHFMGFGQYDIIKVPRDEKIGLMKFRKISWIVLLLILIFSVFVGYLII